MTAVTRMTTDHLKKCQQIAAQHGTKDGKELAAAILAALARRRGAR